MTPTELWPGAQRATEVGAAVFLVLSTALYFLLPTGQSNNFPTYFAALFALGLLWPWRRQLRRSWILAGVLLLCLYLAVSLAWSKPLYDEDVHSILGNAALVLLFVVGVVICHLRFIDFTRRLLQTTVLAAAASGLVLIVHTHLLGQTLDVAPLGRWTTPSVGAIGYGFACVLATNLAVLEKQLRVKLFWLIVATLLAVSCVVLETAYVLFALLSALAVLAFAQLWRKRESGSAFIWAAVCFFLMAMVILMLNVVIDSGRQLIWSSVLDLIYAEKLTFGFGIRSQPGFHINCDLLQFRGLQDCEFRHPHNLYVSTMFYGGVVGITGLVFLMTGAFLTAIESRSTYKWLTVTLLSFGFAVVMFDGNRLISKIDFLWLVFWLPVALAAASEVEMSKDEDADF